MRPERVFVLEGISIDLAEIATIDPQDFKFNNNKAGIIISCTRVNSDIAFTISLDLCNIEEEQIEREITKTTGILWWKRDVTRIIKSSNYIWEKSYYEKHPEYERTTNEVEKFRNAFKAYKDSL